MDRPVPLPRPEESAERLAMRDPLDYLAKYCIVHKERLPAYQRAFNTVMKKKGYAPDQLLPTDQPPPPTRSLRHRRATGVHDDDQHTSSTEEYSTIKGTFGPSAVADDVDSYVSPLAITLTKDEDDMDDGAESLTSDLGTLSRSSSFVGSTSFDAGDHYNRLRYIMDTNKEKVSNLRKKVQGLEGRRIHIIASAARKEFPHVLREDYVPPVKKSKDGKRGKKSEKEKAKTSHSHDPEGRGRRVLFLPNATNVQTAMAVDNGDLSEKAKFDPSSDECVVNRLEKNQLDMLATIPEVERLDLEMGRTLEKLDDAQKRIEELQGMGKATSQVLDGLRRQEDESRPAKSPDFRRKQSPKYQKMNPVTDLEMDVAEVEPALRQINSYLITEKECQYVYHILDLPQRSKINFKLFTVVAALSEKVSRLDPFIRKLINKMDFEALDVKLENARALFGLLANEEEDQDFRPGEVSIRNLAIECAAGGITKEHTQFVVDKFNREGKNYVDFLDYLTYVPLFIEIHDYICNDPLNLDRTR